MTISDAVFNKLSDYIKINFGLNLYNKKPLVQARLCNTAINRGYDSLDDYLDMALRDITGNETTWLVNVLSTNYTYFLREIDHFNFFKNTVMPYLEKTVINRDIGIWSAGCSTGEEPYTIAMMIADYFGKNKDLWDTSILATDISERVLHIAHEGIYNDEQVDMIPSSWKLTYFNNIKNGTWKIEDCIKKEVIFKIFNLMESNYPFKKKFHVIFCRNVMLYFDNDTKRIIVDKFYRLIEPGGYLFIGQSETIPRGETKFKYIMPSVYRKDL